MYHKIINIKIKAKKKKITKNL